MSVREIDWFLERWRMDVYDVLRRMYVALTPRERERWHVLWFLARSWTVSDTPEALGLDLHTIGHWASAFGKGGPAALMFEQPKFSLPALGEAQQEALKVAVQGLSAAMGIGLAN